MHLSNDVIPDEDQVKDLSPGVCRRPCAAFDSRREDVQPDWLGTGVLMDEDEAYGLCLPASGY